MPFVFVRYAMSEWVGGKESSQYRLMLFGGGIKANTPVNAFAPFLRGPDDVERKAFVNLNDLQPTEMAKTMTSTPMENNMWHR